MTAKPHEVAEDESNPDHFGIDDLQSPKRAIPSLDGLRALAVGMVILSHYNGWSNLPRTGLLHLALATAGQGGLGVSIFFVISGFLITTLLLNEKEASQHIAIGSFYFRRAFRIFPPFYTYLIVAKTVAVLAHDPIPRDALLTTAVYVSNYYPLGWIHGAGRTWYVAHTWSLSVEEQFYLVAPFLLNRLRNLQATRLLLTILLVTPFLRLLTVHFMPVYAVGEQWYRLFHTTVDTLATGCLLAFWVRIPTFRARLQAFLRPALLGLALGLLLASGAMFTHTPWWFPALFGISIVNAAIAFLLLYVVFLPGTIPGKLLNTPVLRHLGLISYSLYLYQQLILGPYAAPSSPARLLELLACAELSFWLIERPSLRVRDWLVTRVSQPEKHRFAQ